MPQNWLLLLVLTVKPEQPFIIYFVKNFFHKGLQKIFYNHFSNKFFSVFFIINAAFFSSQSLLFNFLWSFSNLDVEKQDPQLFK